MTEIGLLGKKRNTILLIGKNGQIGWELHRTLATIGEVIALGRKELDLTKVDQVQGIIRRIKPTLVVNAAAYTAVDKAETERELAILLNRTIPGVLADECNKANAFFMHYSTDFVFDGKKNKPYLETDQTNPINYYGETKLAGEEAIKSVGGAFIIFRTSWIYGMRGSNFLLTMLRLAEENKEIRVVSDQVGIPNWSRMIAEATAQIWGRVSYEREYFQDDCLKNGIYHLSSKGETSRFDFAEKIFSLDKDSQRIMEKVIPINSEDYPTAALRPRYSALASEKVTSSFGVQMNNWLDDLKLAFDIASKKDE